MELSQRKKAVLASIIEMYIATGEPVGSKAVCEALNNSCSPATVRNDMAELIEQGFIEQPHTSAGRVPSQAGYRYYIENLMNRSFLTEDDKQKIDSMLPRYVDDPDRFINDAGAALAQITRCTAITSSPVDNGARVKRVEIIPMNSRLVLLAVLTGGGILKNRVCRTEFPIHPDGIELFTTVINERFSGVAIHDISPASMQSVLSLLGSRSLVYAPLLEAFFSAVQDSADSKLRLEGQSNLLNFNDFSTSVIRDILSLLSHRDYLNTLLRTSGDDISVIFGTETKESALKDASIITAMYSPKSDVVGKIGIIGPARMDYRRIIPSISYVASLLEKRLSQLNIE